ncbi:MAG: ABC transporter permease [Candidatus Heimdallarchaeaceae archaeon]
MLTGFGDVLVYTAPGLVFMIVFNTTMCGTACSIREEEFTGTFESIYVTPISRYNIILGNTLFYLSETAIGCSVQIILISIWYKDSFSFVNLILSMFFLLIGILIVQGISMLLVAYVFWQKEGWRSLLLIETFVMFITPISFPIIVLPKFLRGIASINPLTLAVEGFRNAFLYGYNFMVLRYLVILIALIPILTAVSVILYQLAERYLRKKAVFGNY